MLQTAQELWNVVTRFGVQIDRANVNTVEDHLRIDYVAHVLFVRRSSAVNDVAIAPVKPVKLENTWEIDLRQRLGDEIKAPENQIFGPQILFAAHEFS